MNLMHSKMFKGSTRGIINKSVETTTIFSCQLYIQSFKISYRGYVHFIWMSNNSQINSLRYQSSGRLVQVKETLTVNVRSVTKNGREEYPINIYLKLMNQNGEEIDDHEISVNSLSFNFKQIQIPMDRGLIYVKARKKQLNINESQQINHYTNNIYRSKIRRSQQNTNLQEYEILQQQLNRIKKNLQDEEYLNNKLKNDRDILLSTKQELQSQIQRMIMQFTKQISILRQHYETKISIRDHCYEQQIQNQIGTFNSNVQQTKKIMEMILKQKNKCQEDNKILTQKFKKDQLLIKEKQDCILKLNKQITDLKQLNNKFQLQNKLKDEQLIQFKKNNNNLQNQLFNLNLIIKQKQKQNQQNKNLIQKYSFEISQYKNITLQHKNKQNELQQLIRLYKQKQQTFKQQKQLLQKNNKLLQQQNNNLKQQLNKIKRQLQQSLYQLQFNQNVIEQLKKQINQKQNQFYYQIQQIQRLFNRKIQDIINKHEDQILKSHQSVKQLENINKKLQEKTSELINNNSELQKQNKNFTNFDSKSVQASVKAHKSQHPSPNNKKDQVFNEKSIENVDVESLNKRILDLQNQIKDLLKQNKKMKDYLEQYDVSPEDIDGLKQKQKKKQELPQIYQRHKKGIKPIDYDNQKSNIQLEKILQNIPTKKQQVRQFVSKKDMQIGDLKHRVDYLQGLYEHLKIKIDKILVVYPQVDVKVIQEQMAPFIEFCDSEIQEQIELNNQINNFIIDPNSKSQTGKNHVDTKRIQVHDHHGHKHRLSQTKKEQSSKQIKQINLNQFASLNNTKKQSQSRRDLPDIQMTKKQSLSELESPINKKNISDRFISEKNNQKDEKTAKDIKKGILRKESLPSGKLKVETSPIMKKQESVKSLIPSSRSATSYVKVSHSKKIRQLQENNSHLRDRQRQFQNQLKDYQNKIRQLENQIIKYKSLMKQFDEKIMPKINVTQNSRPNKYNQAQLFDNTFSAAIKQNKQSQVNFQDERIGLMLKTSAVFEQNNKNLQQKLNEYSKEMKNLGGQLNKLQKQSRIKQQLLKQQKSNSKIYKQKYQQELSQKQKIKKACQNIQSKHDILQKNLQEIQQKLRQQKQNHQQARLHAKQLNLTIQNLQNQLKKNRKQLQNLQQKYNKTLNNEMIIKELNKQVQDLNKKLLEQLKMINHMKLQKDSQEEEIKILKKKHSDQSRISAELQQSIAALERSIEENKRKQNKLKRQIQEGQEEVRRIKSHSKKLEQQLQSISASQATWQVQRRKHLDQISNLQDQISRKDYQNSKLIKQIQKWKMKCQQRQQYRMGKKSQLRQQIQRLQNQLIRKQKKCTQFSQQNKLLKNRLQLIQRQNKKISQQKNQNYGQKLKYYVDQMSNIKKLLSQYQNENNRLKIQNNQLYQQGQIIRINYDKLQMKYNDSIQRQEVILNDLQSYINQNNILNKKINQNCANIDQLEYAYGNLLKECDGAKFNYHKLQEKYVVSEKHRDGLENQIKQYKIRLSQYQTNYQIHHKLMERYKILQNNKNQIQQQLKKIKNQYNQVINIFVYKKQDVDKIINDIKIYEKKMKQEEIAFIRDDFNRALSSKTQRLQKQILDLYNQINRIAGEKQNYIDENDKINKKNAEMQLNLQKYGSLQDQLKQLVSLNGQMQQDIKKKTQNILKLTIEIQRIENEYNLKDKEVISSRNRIKQLESKIEQLGFDIKNRKNYQNQLKQQIQKLSKKERNKQKIVEGPQQMVVDKKKQTQIIQQYELKIYGFQLQIQKLKDKQIRNMEQNGLKMKKLQEKMNEMEQALKQKQKQMQNHYEYQIQQIQNELYKLSQELQSKIMRQKQLTQALLHLQGQCKLYEQEKQEMGMQFDNQKQNWQSQIMKLRSKIKQTELSYENNLKSLQQQILKNKKEKVSTSRTMSKVGGENDDKNIKRYEEKIKSKDKKIEDLKQTLYTLQQEVENMRRKQSQRKTLTIQLTQLRQANDHYQQTNKSIQQKFNLQLSNYLTQLKQYKSQIILLRQNQQKYKLKLQQKQFQYRSITFELSTIKQLYQQLQKQLQKRKQNIVNNLQLKNDGDYKIKQKQDIIKGLEEKNFILLNDKKQAELFLKKKNNQILILEQKIQIFKDNQNKFKNNQQKLNFNLKKMSEQYQLNLQNLRNQIKILKGQNLKLKRFIQTTKDNQLNQQIYKNEIQKQINDLLSKNRQQEEIVQKYQFLHQKCINQLQINLEELPFKFVQMLEQKQNELNQYMNQIQQLKFLNQRKYLDYDEMKRQNFELHLKNEDNELLYEQVDNLRKICDKIQEEKKQILFREEVLRMQLQNLAVNGPIDFRNRIENILTSNNMMPSLSNFSFH